MSKYSKALIYIFVSNNLLIQRSKSKSFSDLSNLISNIPGIWHVFLNNKQGMFEFNNRLVDTLVWICPWANSSLSSFDYLELDASFHFLKPFCYSIPIVIKNNRSLPIGLSIALSEKTEIYTRFLDEVNLQHKMKVLCDLGSALKKTCQQFRFQRFICHRHLIERFNPNTLTGYLITKICQIKTEENYNKFISYWIPILNYLIKNNKEPVNFSKFKKYLGLEYDSNKETLVESNSQAKNEWAVWRRGCLNTCSNAIESRHGHINNMIKQKKLGLLNRIRLLTEYIAKSYMNFEENGNKVIQGHRFELQEKAKALIDNGKSKSEFSLENCDCPAKKIYELRFGTTGVDCIHTCFCKNRDRTAPMIKLEHIVFEGTQTVFRESSVEWPDGQNLKRKKESIGIISSLEKEDIFISTSVNMIQNIKEIIPTIDQEHLQFQMNEIYYHLRQEEKYSEVKENSKEIMEEWRSRVYYSVFDAFNIQ